MDTPKTANIYISSNAENETAQILELTQALASVLVNKSIRPTEEIVKIMHFALRDYCSCPDTREPWEDID